MAGVSPFDLSGRVAIVTGGGGGIGRPMAVALAEAGADVILAGRRATRLDETCTEIAAAGGRGCAVPLDVYEAGGGGLAGLRRRGRTGGSD